MAATWGEWWCLRWHKGLHIVAHVGVESDHVKCNTCGREYGMHHGVRAILPWSEVRHLYGKR